MKSVGFWQLQDGDASKICGRFRLAVGPVMGAYEGQGFTPTRVGAGDYLLTFTGAVARVISGKACCQIAANDVDMEPQFGTFTPGGAGAATLQILTKTAGADTELPVGAGDWVHFEITFYGECLAV